MSTPTRLEDLFFSVKHWPLQTSIDDELVKVPRYRVVSCPAGVLGVKPAWQADAQPRPTPLGRHLVFDHGQAFDPARFDRKAAEDVLSQRDAYRNLKNRLSSKTVGNAQRLKAHLDSQVSDYEALAREL